MKLDDKPLLELLAIREKRIASLEELGRCACVLINPELAPFEKYCGKVAFAVQAGQKVAITASWQYRAPCGKKLALKATLERQRDGWMMVGKRLAVPVAALSPGAVAEAFITVNQTVAEAVFEAVVLGEGWRLRHILQ